MWKVSCFYKKVHNFANFGGCAAILFPNVIWEIETGFDFVGYAHSFVIPTIWYYQTV